MSGAENVDLKKQISDAEKLLSETKETPVVDEQVVAPVVEESVSEAEPVAEPEPVVEPEEVTHGERSRLGRKVKRLEDTLTDIKGSLDFLRERSTQPAQPVVEEEIELPENPTAEEIKDFVRKDRERLIKNLESKDTEKARAAQSERQKYAKEYAKMVEDTLDPDDDAEIFKLMTDTKDLTYNQVIKGDAKEDFLLNYRNATKAVLNKVKPAKVSTVHGKPPKVPTGVNVPSSTVVSPKTFDRSKLSPLEADVAKMFNDEELASLGIG
jgi:hypothetical protein